MIKLDEREKRHKRIRKKLYGTEERPRLSIFRSNKHIYAQIINDLEGRTLVSASSLEKEINAKNVNCELSKQIGILLGKRGLEKGITRIVFDRSGYQYHGNVKQLAEGAREGGLQF